jgi:putative endonuclease
MQPCFYLLSNRKNGALYAGSTSNLAARINQHRSRKPGSFSARYGVVRLVHAEFHETMPEAMQRERRVKKWKRAWKIELIKRDNPAWNDLYLPMLW